MLLLMGILTPGLRHHTQRVIDLRHMFTGRRSLGSEPFRGEVNVRLGLLDRAEDRFDQ
ncbi:hypothetical protein SAMN04488047_13912 [Tranquillimonas alkanivorans]|uniref:Uncharacterized protein n=1 Tax=Tranquillimonas alkanivorans TaxID=441119 RepID=A0A1I5W3R3_9RHOB|nr:hypothetical protein SAMN04488047_13912 [Tranquillimonas alkanivorans]